MISEIFHGVASDQPAQKNSASNTLHLGPSPSIISKRQLPISSTWNSEVHIARLGDLFKERYKIIHTLICSVARQMIRTE